MLCVSEVPTHPTHPPTHPPTPTPSLRPLQLFWLSFSNTQPCSASLSSLIATLAFFSMVSAARDTVWLPAMDEGRNTPEVPGIIPGIPRDGHMPKDRKLWWEIGVTYESPICLCCESISDSPVGVHDRCPVCGCSWKTCAERAVGHWAHYTWGVIAMENAKHRRASSQPPPEKKEEVNCERKRKRRWGSQSGCHLLLLRRILCCCSC